MLTGADTRVLRVSRLDGRMSSERPAGHAAHDVISRYWKKTVAEEFGFPMTHRMPAGVAAGPGCPTRI